MGLALKIKPVRLEIEPDARAAASLAQVHRARIASTGEQVIVKGQYPDLVALLDQLGDAQPRADENCHDGEPYTTFLKFTGCREGEFTCDGGEVQAGASCLSPKHLQDRRQPP